MKIIWTAPAKKLLQEGRAEIERALETYIKAHRPGEQLATQRDKLAAEIEQLKDAKASDAAAMRLLGEKRTALEQVEEQIAELPDADPELENELRHLLAGNAVHKKGLALTATIEAFEADVAKRLLPFCSDKARALVLARQTDACASLRNFVGRRPGFHAPIEEAVKQVLAEFDEILSGELNWSFTPKA